MENLIENYRKFHKVGPILVYYRAEPSSSSRDYYVRSMDQQDRDY